MPHVQYMFFLNDCNQLKYLKSIKERSNKVWESLLNFYKLWVLKGSYFYFESPQQQVDMHAKSKTLSFSYNMCLVLSYLLNDYQISQTLCVQP